MLFIVECCVVGIVVLVVLCIEWVLEIGIVKGVGLDEIVVFVDFLVGIVY